MLYVLYLWYFSSIPSTGAALWPQIEILYLIVNAKIFLFFFYGYFSVQCPVLLMFNSVFRNHCLRNNYSYDFKCSSKHSLCFVSPVLSVGVDILGKQHHPCCTEKKWEGWRGRWTQGTTSLVAWTGQARSHRTRHKINDSSRMLSITQILNLSTTMLLLINKEALTRPACNAPPMVSLHGLPCNLCGYIFTAK